MRFHTVVLAAMFVSGSAFGAGFELKGVELGKFASHEQLHQALGVVCFHDCRGRTVVAGAQCATVVIFNDEKMVDKIVATFSFSDFQTMKDAFTSKYGEPKEHFNTPVVSGGGVHANRVIGIWRDDAGNELVLENYSDQYHGQIVLRTRARIELEKHKANEI